MTDIPEGYEEVQQSSDIPAGYEEVSPTGFGSNVSNDLGNRWQTIQDIGNRARAGQLSFPKTALKMAGQETGALNDVIGEGLKSAYNSLTTQNMRNNAAENINNLANSSLGKLATSAINKGVGAWNQYESQNPDAAQNIKDVANIGSGVLGAKGLMDLGGSAAGALSGLGDLRDGAWNGASGAIGSSPASALSTLDSSDISGNAVSNFFAKNPNPLKVGMQTHDSINQAFDAAKGELSQAANAARNIAPAVDVTPVLNKLDNSINSLSGKAAYGEGEENALSALNDIRNTLASKAAPGISTAGETVSKPTVPASDLMDIESSINAALPKGKTTMGSRHLIDAKSAVQDVLSNAGDANPEFGAAYDDYKNKAISLAKNFSNNPSLKGLWQPNDYLTYKAYQNSIAAAKEANPLLRNMSDESVAAQINSTLPADQQISPYSPAALTRIGNVAKNLGKGDLGTVSTITKILPGDSNALLRQALLINKEKNVSLGSALKKLTTGDVQGGLQTGASSLMTGGRTSPLESTLKNLKDLKNLKNSERY